MHISQERRNLITVANIVELTSLSIAKTISKGDVKEIYGVKQTRQSIADTVAVKLNARLNDHVRGI